MGSIHSSNSAKIICSVCAMEEQRQTITARWSNNDQHTRPNSTGVLRQPPSKDFKMYKRRCAWWCLSSVIWYSTESFLGARRPFRAFPNLWCLYLPTCWSTTPVINLSKAIEWTQRRRTNPSGSPFETKLLTNELTRCFDNYVCLYVHVKHASANGSTMLLSASIKSTVSKSFSLIWL